MNESPFTSIARKLMHRPVTVTGAGTNYVRPPTVREAILLFGLLSEIESPAAKNGVVTVTGGWFPIGLQKVFSSPKTTWDERIGILSGILKTFEIEKDEPEEDDKKSGFERDTDFELLLAEYHYAFKTDPLDTPWPYFMSNLRNLTAVKAVWQLDNISWYGSYKAGKVDALYKAARIRRSNKSKDFDGKMPDYMSTDDWKEQQKKAASDMKEHIKKTNKPKVHPVI